MKFAKLPFTIIATGLTLALLGIAGSPASAQVNTEKLRKMEKAGFSGHTEVSASFLAGNVDLLQLGVGLRVQYATLEPTLTPESASPSTLAAASAPTPEATSIQSILFLVGDLQYGRNADEKFLSLGFAHLRWTRMWLPAIGTELFIQLQYNEFIKLEQRLLAGVGLRLPIIDTAAFQVTFGTGYMLEFERLDVPADGPDEREVLAHRSTNYVSLRFNIDEPRVHVVNTTYFQPRITQLRDVRVLDEAELEIKIVDELAFVVGLGIRYDSEPPENVRSLDVVLVNKFRVAF